ncbi:MAG: NAD-dependent deacylase [Prolixibacteraceae bacterium]|nr:NAD-dependent deacylase [Prolixibacteraceae bacterium]
MKQTGLKTLVVLTGAGMSQESGIRTFRDSGGMWEEHNIMDVASPEGWKRNPEMVLKFYNERRKQLLECQPNSGHIGLAELEKKINVNIITQNVDDLHERAGSTKVLHLHGELKKARSTVDPGLIYEIEGWQLNIGDKCKKGSKLRPHIVWFGEAVPEINNAIQLVQNADIMAIIGTSMQVYPAAGLINWVNKGVPVFLIDPNPSGPYPGVHIIMEKAGKGVEILTKEIERLI